MMKMRRQWAVSHHRIPDPYPKTTIRAAPFRILLWYLEKPPKTSTQHARVVLAHASPTHPEHLQHSKKQTGIISSKGNGKHLPKLQVRAPTIKSRHRQSRRRGGGAGIHVHAAAASWGNGTTRSASTAPESRPRWTTSDSAALLQQKCTRVGGYDFRRTGRSGGGQGVRTVREQALVRGAGRTARAPHR